MVNILNVLLDDIGLEQFNRFGRGSNYPATPTIDSWYDGGVRFTKHYVQQLCSPTRATCLTGVHPFRHGIGDLVRGPILSASTSAIRQGLSWPTTAMHLRQHRVGVRTAAIGKWHVSTEYEGGLLAPGTLGFDHYSVNMFNLPGATLAGGSGGQNYYRWDKNVRGKLVSEDEYMPAVNVREAADWIKQRGSDPWMMHLAPYACHTPLVPTGIPPTGTYNPAWNTATENGAFKACIEAIDYYLGVLQSSIPPLIWQDTLVFLSTDNGSGVGNSKLEVDPLTGTNYPDETSNHSKDTPYDGGTHTPLIVFNAGSLVTSPGRTITHPVMIADIAATILDYYGVDPVLKSDGRYIGLDGRSLRGYLENTTSGPIHDFVYSEHFLQNHGANVDTGEAFAVVMDKHRVENQWVAYDGQYTLIYNRPLASTQTRENPNNYFEFYDLDADPHQLTNLTPGGVTTSLTTAQAARRTALLEGRAVLLRS